MEILSAFLENGMLNPSTGDTSSLTPVIIAGALIVAAVVLLIVLRKKKDQ